MNKKRKPTFDRSRKALRCFSAFERRMDRALNQDELDNATVLEWLELRKKAQDMVRKAFFEDTKAFNSRDNCMIVDLGFIQRMADL